MIVERPVGYKTKVQPLKKKQKIRKIITIVLLF